MDKLPDILGSIPYLLEGAGYTVAITAVALSIGFCVGLPLALMRVYGDKLASSLAAAYSTVLRGLPALVVLFILFYGLSSVISLPAFVAGCLALGVCSSAYQMELLRGAIQSVGPGQMMAARALGMDRLQAIAVIVLPQALRLALPAWSNEVAYMVKYSSVVFIIAVPDLLARGQFIISKHYNPMEILITVGAIYLGMVLVISTLMGQLERRLRIPGLELEVERA